MFAPRREHARFCTAWCRVEWNRENSGDRASEMSALDWSIAAMREATGRLRKVGPCDPARAYTAASEAVWWVTIVDATLVRYHTEAYDGVLESEPPAERAVIEDTLAGLRFVRNQISEGADRLDFIGPGASAPGNADGGITAWRWNPVPSPALGQLPPRARAWEMTRYRAYQTRLANHTLGETFGRSAAFLGLAVARAAAARDLAPQAAPGAAAELKGVRPR